MPHIGGLVAVLYTICVSLYASFSSGDVRLVGGVAQNSGRVEVFYGKSLHNLHSLVCLYKLFVWCSGTMGFRMWRWLGYVWCSSRLSSTWVLWSWCLFQFRLLWSGNRTYLDGQRRLQRDRESVTGRHTVLASWKIVAGFLYIGFHLICFQTASSISIVLDLCTSILHFQSWNPCHYTIH